MTKRTFSTPFRRLYLFRFVFRCVVFAASVLLYVRSPQPLTALQGFGFFHSFTLLHLLWLLWMADMVSQLCRCRWYWPEGSQKFLDRSVLPPQSADDRAALRRYVRANNRRAAVMGAAWLAVTLAVGALYLGGCIDAGMILLICEFFYVCDVFCVVFWCPFRAWFLKNRCCTTCRVFNWDHLMMFAPLVFIPGFFTWTLFFLALAVFLTWEITFVRHPERFWEKTNPALRCANCTDRLCGRPAPDAAHSGRA